VGFSPPLSGGASPTLLKQVSLFNERGRQETEYRRQNLEGKVHCARHVFWSFGYFNFESVRQAQDKFV